MICANVRFRTLRRKNFSTRAKPCRYGPTEKHSNDSRNLLPWLLPISCLAAGTEDSVCFDCWFAIGLVMQVCISLILYTFHCIIRLKLNLDEKIFFLCLSTEYAWRYERVGLRRHLSLMLDMFHETFPLRSVGCQYSSWDCTYLQVRLTRGQGLSCISH
jgi:hypothetical protein